MHIKGWMDGLFSGILSTQVAWESLACTKREYLFRTNVTKETFDIRSCIEILANASYPCVTIKKYYIWKTVHKYTINKKYRDLRLLNQTTKRMQFEHVGQILQIKAKTEQQACILSHCSGYEVIIYPSVTQVAGRALWRRHARLLNHTCCRREQLERYPMNMSWPVCSCQTPMSKSNFCFSFSIYSLISVFIFGIWMVMSSDWTGLDCAVFYVAANTV